MSIEEEALRKVKAELTRHPGDAPWSCLDCYHNRPCIDKLIYKLAEKELENLVYQQGFRK